MHKYDGTRYDPAAPVAEAALRDMNGGASVHKVLLLLDTGADITLLPRAAVEALGVKPLPSDYELVGFDGSKSRAEAVDLDMIFLKRAYRGRYLLIDDDRGVLGRDVLANIVVLLDGPREQWSQYKGP